MMLDKKQIQAIFLFEFKMSCKEMETTHNIKKAFGPGTAKERTVKWWFKKFCQGDESLEDEELSGWASEVGNNYLRAITESDLLTSTGGIAEKLNVDHSIVIWPLKKIGKVKNLNPGFLRSKLQIKKIITLKCPLLLFHATTMNNF